MSLRVIGYQDGKRVVVDEGESRARVAGYGGSAMSHAITVIKHVPRSTVPLREKDRRRALQRKEGGR